MNLPNYNSHKGIIEVQKRIALKHMFQEEPEWELSEKKTNFGIFDDIISSYLGWNKISLLILA